MSTNYSNVIVVFKDNVSDAVINNAAAQIEKEGGKIGHRYNTTMKGFAATIPDNHISTLKEHEHLDYIEADGEVSIYAKSIGI